MTYEAKETSIAQGEPFECYLFNSPNGTFRYTSLPEDVTLASQVWTPLPIERTSFDIEQTIGGVKTVDFMLPLNSEIPNNYASDTLPGYLTVFVYRAHVGDDLSSEYSIEWRGEAVVLGIRNDQFIVKTQSIIGAKIINSVNTVYYQYACNNRVYDSRCKATKASFTTAAVVQSFDHVKITVDTVGALGDGDLSLGTMVNTRTGEERSIYTNTGLVVEVTYPFLDIQAGDNLSLILGCDNRMTTCINRFNNVENFTGFRYIPLVNPFIQEEN